jgi:drug/metabolite transporter (DMT)-like permease
MPRRELTYAALVATSMVWGGAFVAIKQALQYLTPLQLLAMRFLPASLAFAMLLGWRHRSVLGSMLRRDWLSLCAMGLFGVVIYHTALNTGEQLISAGTASLLMALNPAFIFLMSVFLWKERVTWTRTLGLLLAFAGLVVVVRLGSDGKIQLGMVRGVLITLIAPLAWSVYTLISRPLAARYPPLAVTGLGTMLGTIPILVTVDGSLAERLSAMPWDGWLSIAYLALAATVGGVSMWVTALEQLEASRVGAFIYLVPLWAALLSRWLLGEPLTLSLGLGAALIILGVALVNR